MVSKVWFLTGFFLGIVFYDGDIFIFEFVDTVTAKEYIGVGLTDDFSKAIVEQRIFGLELTQRINLTYLVKN